MSFDHLRTAFLERWGNREREREAKQAADRERERPHSARAFSMPPPGSESGSEVGDMHSHTGAMVPAHVTQQQFPPAAPTPPNEPTSDREHLVQETKTSIAINAEQGSGQIVLSISNNRHRKKKKAPTALENTPSRDSSPPPQQPQQDPKQHVQVIEADPDREGYMDDRYRDSGTPPPSAHHRGGDRGIDRGMTESPPIHPPHRTHGMHNGSMHNGGVHNGVHSHALTRPPTPPRDDRSLDRSLELMPPAPSTPPPPPLRARLLEGKIVAITGASRGIGRAIALGFAKEGAHIIAHYWGTKSDPANEEIVSLCVAIRGMGQGCTIVFGDISDPRTSEAIVRRAVETYGRLDVAVGNAGMCWYRDLFDVTPELLRRHVDVNLNGNFYFVQAAARQFKRQFHDAEAEADGDAAAGPANQYDYSILCISSSTTGQGMAHFSPTAAGVRELMKTCAVGLGKYGVRCNTLSPGVVQTKMVHEELMDMEKRGAVEKRVPLGRLGVPGDVVGPAVWLASDMGRFVTGAEIRVDGGSAVNV